MDCSNINLDFFPFYVSGERIRVGIGYGVEKTGKVGVSQGKYPTLWLISRGGFICELTKQCSYLGPAIRKTRTDCKLYLQGRKAAYPYWSIPTKQPAYKLRKGGGHVPDTGVVGSNNHPV